MTYWDNRDGLGLASARCKAACRFPGEYIAATASTDRPQCCTDPLDGSRGPWCARNYYDDEWCACATYTMLPALVLFFTTCFTASVSWMEVGSVYRRHLRDVQNSIPDLTIWHGWQTEYSIDFLVSLCSLPLAGAMAFAYSLVVNSFASGDPCAWAKFGEYSRLVYLQFLWTFIVIIRHTYGCGKYCYKYIRLPRENTVQPISQSPDSPPVMMISLDRDASKPESPSGMYCAGEVEKQTSPMIQANRKTIHAYSPSEVELVVTVTAAKARSSVDYPDSRFEYGLSESSALRGVLPTPVGR